MVTLPFHSMCITSPIDVQQLQKVVFVTEKTTSNPNCHKLNNASIYNRIKRFFSK